MRRSRLPPAVCLDLDDTILDDSLNIQDCWETACDSCRDVWGDLERGDLLDAIERVRDWFWSDPDRHRRGRLELRAARTEIVRLALLDLGIEDPVLAARIGASYSDLRERRLAPLPGAIDTVRWLRASGCRLALLTNGGATGQRSKLARFDLESLFDLILIEGELGFGKPDPRVFERALAGLAVAPADAWMVGDNLEWDVAAPQRLGMFAVWVDARRNGLPDASAVRPNRIVHRLSDLRAPGESD